LERIPRGHERKELKVIKYIRKVEDFGTPKENIAKQKEKK